MRSATLREVQLNGADLATEFILDGEFECFARTREVFMTECVGSAALCSFANVCAVSGADTLGNGNDDVRMLFKCFFKIGIEIVEIERYFGEIYEVGLYVRIERGKSCRRRKPACITTHDLYDGNGFYGINGGVAEDLLHGGCDIFCGRAVAGGVVCAGKVVVDGLRYADDAHIVADALCEFGELRNGIHRVVTADIEEITNVKFLENGDDIFKGLSVFALKVLGELFAARAECRRRGIFEKLQIFFGHVADVDERFFENAFNAVFSTVYGFNGITFDRAANNTCESCVDSCCGTAGLTDDSISVKFFHDFCSPLC